MKYIEIKPRQHIALNAMPGSTPTQAIVEAIWFCIANKTEQCDLHYNGFTFGIDPDSDINQLVAEYRAWGANAR
jgi:hypothetical protein